MIHLSNYLKYMQEGSLSLTASLGMHMDMFNKSLSSQRWLGSDLLFN